MPELPEVQTIANHLKVFEEKQLIDIKVHDYKLISQETLDQLKGKNLLSITRRGKYLHFSFSENRSLIIHLRMTGQFLIRQKREKHDRATFFFFHQPPLFFKDTRRFGCNCCRFWSQTSRWQTHTSFGTQIALSENYFRAQQQK